jgi:hypothetical protein
MNLPCRPCSTSPIPSCHVQIRGPSRFVFWSSVSITFVTGLVLGLELADINHPRGFEGKGKLASAVAWTFVLMVFVVIPGVAAWIERHRLIPHWTAAVASAWSAAAVFFIALYAVKSWPNQAAFYALLLPALLTGIGALRLHVASARRPDPELSARECQPSAPETAAKSPEDVETLNWLRQSWGPDLMK